MSIFRRIKNFFSRDSVEREIDAELKSHIEMRIEDNLAAGMSPQRARHDAAVRFGNSSRIKERVVSMDIAIWLDTLARDLRYALRQLRKSPGFTLTALLTLALGIGGAAAVFSVVESVLLRPLPFHDPDRLISLHESIEHDPHEFSLTAPDILIFQRQAQAFSSMGGYIGSQHEVTGAGSPFQAQSERVTASLFPTLGIEPFLGRNFTQQEDSSSAPVTVLSYAMWRERLHSDPNAIGKTIDLNRRPYTIVGVMPRNFEFPLDAGRLSHRDLWVPMSFSAVEKDSEGENYDYSEVARLKPGVTPAQAQHDIDRIIAALQPEYMAKSGIHLSGYFRTLKEETVHNARPLFNVLLAAVALLLLIACVNLTNLLLVRASTRKQEFGMRLALGAARRVMLRQLLTESLLLSALGGLAGVVVAIVLVRVAAVSLPDSLPRLGEIAVRWPVFAAAFGLIGLTGIACGVAPALAGMKTDPLDSLRGGSQSTGQARSQHKLRGLLVAAEVAMATLLLVASGLLLRSLAKMLETDPGFQSQHVLTASLSLSLHDYPTQQKVDAFYQQAQARIAALPGVSVVGFSTNIPIVGQNSGRLISPQGYVRPSGEGWLITSNYLVQGSYFEALHIPLIRGRYFNEDDDRSGAPLVALIGQSFADHYFHGKDPIGMSVKVGDRFDSAMPAIRIVGVVGNIRQGALDQPIVDQMYEPISQAAADLGPMAPMIGVVGGMDLVVRTTQDPKALAESLEKIVHQLDPLLPVSRLRTMDEIVAATNSSRRFNTTILTAFATTALLLSLIGIYGVVAYSVTERTREIAIRMAVGANRQAVLLRTLRYALNLAAAGVLIGIAAAAGLTHFLNNLLYGVKPLDGISIAAAVVVLFACSAVAGSLPAYRAASIDPMQALRAE